VGRAIRRESGDAAALGAADWLSLAAAPAFAIMALLTAAHGGGPADILCSAAHEGLPLSGMTLMYVLMSIFHSAPWLKLISRQTKRPQGARPTRNKAAPSFRTGVLNAEGLVRARLALAASLFVLPAGRRSGARL
jgi:hypothetical protein